MTPFIRISALCFNLVFGLQLAAEPLRVVTLHTVLTEIAREVGGDQVAVTPLLKPGVDPHVFEPAPADIRRLRQADLVLAAGLGLETYLDRLAGDIGRDRLVRVGDDLPGLLHGACTHGHDHDGHQHDLDPHWWLGVTQMLAAVDRVTRELSARRPMAAADFDRNAAVYRTRLEALRAWISSKLSVLPGERRQLITAHDAFGYFAHEHGFAVHPLLGTSTAAEADARQVAAVVKLIRARGIRTVFVEDAVNPRLIEAIVRDTGARLGPPLYSSGLGPGAVGTYEGMMRHNVTAIVEGLR
jgi:zinc/manganese transport system substrate-binding protein